MDGIPCFFLEPTLQFRRYLRRFVWSTKGRTCGEGYHNLMMATEDVFEIPKFPDDGFRDDEWPHDDPRWPKACTCGYEFQPGDEWQHTVTRLLRRADTGELMTWQEAAEGAMMYHDSWNRRGPDGHALAVKVPHNHVWWPDERAGNCDRKQDKEHYCWCRHGKVPQITVDKLPPEGHSTCGAGAGSILTEAWHGFLRDGRLVKC